MAATYEKVRFPFFMGIAEEGFCGPGVDEIMQLIAAAWPVVREKAGSAKILPK